LGNVALRTGAKVVWDAANERAVGLPEADAYIHRKYLRALEAAGAKS
jgi:hypothetical protein